MRCRLNFYKILGLIVLVCSGSGLEVVEACQKRPLPAVEQAFYEKVTTILEEVLPSPKCFISGNGELKISSRT